MEKTNLLITILKELRETNSILSKRISNLENLYIDKRIAETKNSIEIIKLQENIKYYNNILKKHDEHLRNLINKFSNTSIEENNNNNNNTNNSISLEKIAELNYKYELKNYPSENNTNIYNLDNETTTTTYELNS